MSQDRWWTESGWATKGSQLQTQLYVNERPQELSAAVCQALPSLAEWKPSIRWVAPLRAARFAEPRDEAFLHALDLDRLAPALKEFWPARGPVWDALAVCTLAGGGKGVILAEGKNYPAEMYSGGSQAGKTGSPKALESRSRIEAAMTWAQGELGLPPDAARWMDPLDPARPSSSLYQTANRLAHLLWLRSQGVEAWLCHLLYLDDPMFKPTDEKAWEAALARAERELGIDGVELPFAGHAFVKALDPDMTIKRPSHA